MDEATAEAEQAIAWESARARALMRVQEQAAGRREDLAQRAEQQDAEEAQRGPDAAAIAFVHRATGRPSLSFRGVIAKVQALTAPDDTAGRDPRAECGTAARPEVLISVGGQLVPMRPRETAGGPVTLRSDSIPAQLARARQQPGREFMQREIRELERRHAEGGRGVISRSQTPETITCVECIKENVTVDEYLALHHGDDAIPEKLVPDYAPSRSGTGRQVPMIYR